jgi:hypothetical protein
MAIWEVVFSGTRYAQMWQNKLHFESLEGFAGDAQSISNLMDTHYVEPMKFLQTNETLWLSIAVKQLGGSPVQFTKPLAKQGGQGGEPQNFTFVAGVVQKKTGLAGRANRGRIYVPGIRGGEHQGGVFTAPNLANWTTQLNLISAQFINPLPHSLRMVVKHPEGSTPVSSLNMRPILGVMRTRNIGVGA